MGYFGDPATGLTLENVLKIKTKKEFATKARTLANIAIKEQRYYLIYVLAREMGYRGISVSKLEKSIINSRNPYFIFKFAREVIGCNIQRLQKAIIATKDIVEVAKFGCFIRGSDKEMIQGLVLESRSPKAAYMILRFDKSCNVEHYRNIILKSKRPRYLFLLAQKSTDPKDTELLQNMIINSYSNMYVRLFARHIPGADIKKLEERIIKTNDLEEMRRFAKVVKSERIGKLLLLG